MSSLLLNNYDNIKSDSLDALLSGDAIKLRNAEITKDRIERQLDEIGKAVSFWREYPDYFIDFMKGPDSKFNLFFYQRVFLRAVMRHKYSYCVFPRAYSKSFLAVMSLMTKCVLFPGAKLFITSGGKEQAANIAKEKIDEIVELIPGFRREIDWKRTQFAKDYVKLVFKNGSQLDIIAASQRTRGARRHGGLMEEAILIDGTLLNEVIIPTMNVNRRCANGETDPDEVLNKSQIYVTTAGWKGTFAYEKLIQIVIWQVLKPGLSIHLGGTWRVPVLMELLDRNFVKDLKADGTFNESSFAREYESVWSGSTEDAFFNSDMFDRYREIKQPEYEYSGRSTKSSYYMLSVDVGRHGCSSVVCVFKVIPQPEASSSLKKLVNMFTFDEEHMGVQAARIKQLYYKYNAQQVVIDANGLGTGLIDFMIIPTENKETGETYVPFGISNDETGEYKKFKTPEMQQDAVFIIKANAPLNTIIHGNAQTQLSSGKVRFLEDERFAKSKLLGTKLGEKMSPEQRAEYLRPFTLTSILKEEMMNLREEHEGQNIILKQANRKIKKDKFSAFEYGLYYIKLQDESKKKKRKNRISDFMFYS